MFYEWTKYKKFSNVFLSKYIFSRCCWNSSFKGSSYIMCREITKRMWRVWFSSWCKLLRRMRWKVSLEQYKNNYFESWETFFNTLSPFRTKSQHIRRKIDIIFQIIYNLIHNGKRKTPMHVALSEAIHDTSRSKKLIRIMNHLGLCTSYEEVERIDTALVQHTMNMTGSHRVPIPSSIVPHELVHEAMDNFDHKETQFLASEEVTTLSSCYFKTFQWTVTDK